MARKPSRCSTTSEAGNARQQRIRESSGWTAINWASFGKIK